MQFSKLLTFDLAELTEHEVIEGVSILGIGIGFTAICQKWR